MSAQHLLADSSALQVGQEGPPSSVRLREHSPRRVFISPREETFKNLLQTISDSLGKDDVTSIAFHRNLRGENAASSLKILTHLYRCGVFKCDDVDPLIELLKKINRNDLVHSVESYKNEFGE